DPNFATTMTNALAGKQPLDSTLTTLSGKTADGIIEYLRLGEAAKMEAATAQIGANGWLYIPVSGGKKMLLQWGLLTGA
ncbi:phage tail protein, partial [Enterobacter hormaechei subsp. steigerwaltii]|nr:phage tail protein [Enterobacter hormaechei subsp. steigerwaltii]MCC9406879.1 phage tail protein [Enterobacter hormaechei subsp. steigerwaltii]MCC9471781.1 phage tail protein [Enterobacter hormaechei subsp. steigerwaltii]MCU2304688.1 phage tail protein [Enterobacter hormaechei subsp. steigerwaltii]MCU2314850.1 phage tail protein [Enterobacter hormaechei subsp. steigerwaltii]